MPDWDSFQIGGVTFPITTSSDAELLFDADKALYYALDFWAYVIRTYAGPRFVQECAAANVTWAKRPIADAVAQWYPFEPLPEQLENQFQFPLLAAYRRETQSEWYTVGYEVDSTSLELLYVLPPLNAAQTQRILPILHAIEQALRRKTTDGWDPGYTPPGGGAGDQPWSRPYANVESIGFGEDRKGNRGGGLSRMSRVGFLPAGEGKGLYFPTLTMVGFIRERDEYYPTGDPGGPAKFDGADITLNVAAADGTRVLATDSGIVRVSTQSPPAITNVSPASGPASGGTAVTITGARFLAGPPLVYFGPASAPQYSPAVAIISPTTLVVTTPAMQGAGTVDVTVQNRDGQQTTAAQSFTFT